MTPQRAVDRFRRARRKTVELWRGLENKAFEALAFGFAEYWPEDGAPVRFFAINKHGDSADLVMVLPNGRPIYYRDVRREAISEDRAVLKHKNRRLYGGLLTENLIQALARDLLTGVIFGLTMTSTWYEVVGHVHDEIVLHVDQAAFNPRHFESIVKEWVEKAIRPKDEKVCRALPSLPLAAEYFTAKTFAKGPLDGEEKKIEVIIDFAR